MFGAVDFKPNTFQFIGMLKSTILFMHDELCNLTCLNNMSISISYMYLRAHCLTKSYISFFISQQEAYSKLGGRGEIVIRITDACANTALHKAAQAGNLLCLQWLVEQLPNDSGCLRNITNQDHHTTLAVAIKVWALCKSC